MLLAKCKIEKIAEPVVPKGAWLDVG